MLRPCPSSRRRQIGMRYESPRSNRSKPATATHPEQRSTTLVVDGEEIGPRRLYNGFPQGSPLSPILFLFYNGPLLERLESTNLPISPLGVADDINLLAFGNTTASNCEALEQAHRICMQWAEKHGMKFALHKYTLTHFTKQRLKTPTQS